MILPGKHQSFPSKRLFEEDSDEEDIDEIRELSSSEEDCTSGKKTMNQSMRKSLLLQLIGSKTLGNSYLLQQRKVPSLVFGMLVFMKQKNQESCALVGYCDVFCLMNFLVIKIYYASAHSLTIALKLISHFFCDW